MKNPMTENSHGIFWYYKQLNESLVKRLLNSI